MFDSYQLVEVFHCYLVAYVLPCIFCLKHRISCGSSSDCGVGLMIFSFVIILICTGCPVDLQVIVGLGR